MNAYIVVESNILDAEKLAEYSTLAAKTVNEFDGEFIFKGPIETLHGETSFTNKAVIKFLSEEQAKAWYHSDHYQALTSLREQAMSSQFHLVY